MGCGLARATRSWRGGGSPPRVGLTTLDALLGQPEAAKAQHP